LEKLSGNDFSDEVIVINAMNNLVSSLRDQGELDEGIPADAVLRLRRIHGNKHHHTRITIGDVTWLTVLFLPQRETRAA
jgi:hypothetical protein